jgi:multidrug efflux pump subunit AcrA (membrane-fusion protein)
MNARPKHWLRCLMLLAAMHAPTTLAAPNPEQTIPFTAEQINSLGIRLSPPQPASHAAGADLSAKVIAAPDAEWVVTAPAGGVVVRVPVSEGDVIKAGTTLVELRSAEAPKMSAELAQAGSVAKLARAERDRDRQLHDEGIIAARRLQTSEQAAAQAESALTAARMHLKLMGMTASDAGTGRVLARAPAASTVLERLVTPGQRVNEADPLLRLVDADKLMIELQVPIADDALAVGDTLALPDGRRATVKQSGWGTSDLAQSVRVRAALPAGTSGLRPGQWLKVQREITTRAAWTLPTTAISRQDQDTVVFVKDAAGFRAVPVSIVGGDAVNTTVTGALSETSMIATTGTIAIKGAWLGHGGSN